jgi:hypothetical protein
VAELVDALDLGSSAARRESSSLSFRTSMGNSHRITSYHSVSSITHKPNKHKAFRLKPVSARLTLYLDSSHAIGNYEGNQLPSRSYHAKTLATSHRNRNKECKVIGQQRFLSMKIGSMLVLIINQVG